MKTIQEMVQKATGATGTLLTCSLIGIKEIEAFAALVREDERQIIIVKNAPEIERVNEHLKNLERQIAIAAIKEALVREEERERIAKWYESEGHMMFPVAIPNAIRSGK